jgi:hypothetical protein
MRSSVLCVLVVLWAVVAQGSISEMNSGLDAACGGPPAPTCAASYWWQGVEAWEDVATGYYELFNDPSFPDFCFSNAQECATIQQDFQMVLTYWQYAMEQYQSWT